MGKMHTALMAVVIVSLINTVPLWAGETERNQARRIHDRLTGITATNTIIDAMEALLLADRTGKTAAEFAIDTAQNPAAWAFYNITLKNFAAPWTNEEQTVFTPLNDYSQRSSAASATVSIFGASSTMTCCTSAPPEAWYPTRIPTTSITGNSRLSTPTRARPTVVISPIPRSCAKPRKAR